MCPPPLKEYYLNFFLITFHLDSHGTTDIKPETLSGVRTGNGTPHDGYNRRGFAHVRANRKEYIFMQRQGKSLHVYWSGAKGLYPARAYTTLVVLVTLKIHYLDTVHKSINIHNKYMIDIYALILNKRNRILH